MKKVTKTLNQRMKGCEIVSVKDKGLTTNVDKHVVDDETVDKTHEFEVKTNENFSGLSTDEILILYENVEINEDDIIPVEEIMKIYETCDLSAEDFPTKKSTRKRLHDAGSLFSSETEPDMVEAYVLLELWCSIADSL